MVALLVFAVNCRMPSKQILNELFRRTDFKCQTSDIDHCVDNRLEATSVDEVCMIGEDEINPEGNDQCKINEVYEALSRPNCKNLILKAIDECDGFRDFPGLRECDTNMNGEPCYSFSNRAFSYVIDTEIDCYVELNGTCTC